jgi:predicted MFS family arabinose efflux permease
MPSRRRRLLPLVLATTATQASIVVLVPILVEAGRDLGASVSAVGQARTVLALTAVAAALAVGPLIDRLGVRPAIVGGASLALAGAVGAASAPSLVAFHAAHVAVGAGVACLLSAGFAGVPAYFDDRDAPWAIGYVVAAQSVAWVVGNPLVGLLADAASWRLSYLVPGGFAALALAAGLLAPPSRPPRERAGGRPGGGLGVVLRDRSARSWAIAELVAYSAWTAELTYAGAFYVHSYGVSETAVGLLLAAGSLAFVVATLSTARLTRRFGRRRVIVGGALLMGTMLIPVLNVTPAVWFTLGLFWLMALGAGVRSTASSALGLVQLPAAAGSMMAARTASAQLGYAIGAAAGGAVLAAWGFGALGFVLFGGMAFSALLVARVRDPRVRAAPPPLGNPVPD